MPTSVKQNLSNIQEGIELVSNGLLLLDQSRGTLEALGGKQAVDIAARLNASYGALERLLDPMKSHIKAEGLLDMGNGDTSVIRGGNHEAVVKRIVKTVLDTDKIKTYLSKQLGKFQTTRNETQVSFRPKG